MFIQRARKPSTDPGLTHRCCRLPGLFSHQIPSTEGLSTLSTSHSVNKLPMTLTAALSRPPLRRAAVVPPSGCSTPVRLPWHNDRDRCDDCIRLRGGGGGGGDAVIRVMCRTVMCYTYKHRWAVALLARDWPCGTTEELQQHVPCRCWASLEHTVYCGRKEN